MNYRDKARGFLKRAEEELETKDNGRLKYAVLELRMGMEAITYDRALAYKDEFPASEYETWQLRKVMSVLLEIDPMADQDCSLAIGFEREYGKPAPEMKSMGSEKVLNMKAIREHYDALGSYLHMPTIKQIQIQESHDFDKMRSRCMEIASFLKGVLSSPVFNITLGKHSKVSCGECGKPIRKRIPHKQCEVLAECYNDNNGNKCPASYIIVDKGNGQVEWHPHQHEIQCANDDCQHKIIVWHREVENGRCWTCPGCKGRNVFSIGIRFEPKNSSVDFHSKKTADGQKNPKTSISEITAEQKTVASRKSKAAKS